MNSPQASTTLTFTDGIYFLSRTPPRLFSLNYCLWLSLALSFCAFTNENTFQSKHGNERLLQQQFNLSSSL